MCTSYDDDHGDLMCLLRFPGCARDDLRGLRVPDDVPQALQLQCGRLQLPHCRLWPAVGAANAGLVPLPRLHRWQDQDWRGEVRNENNHNYYYY